MGSVSQNLKATRVVRGQTGQFVASFGDGSAKKSAGCGQQAARLRKEQAELAAEMKRRRWQGNVLSRWRMNTPGSRLKLRKRIRPRKTEPEPGVVIGSGRFMGREKACLPEPVNLQNAGLAMGAVP